MKSTILVVDGKSDIFNMVKEAINHKDIDFIQAESCTIAMNIIKEKIISLVFVNAESKDVDCYKMLKEIRNCEAIKNLPVVVISNSFDQATINTLASHKASKLLIQPLQKDEIQVVVKLLLKAA